MAGDMTVTVNGSLALAEAACRQTFGEAADLGPVTFTPPPLMKLLADWPLAMRDQPIEILLHLPPAAHQAEAGPDQLAAIRMTCCRVTVLHAGRTVGYALRTDEPGLNAIAAWWAAARLTRQKRLDS